MNWDHNPHLRRKNISQVGPLFQQMNLETYAMISSCIMCDNASCCYPENFIEWLRQLFDNPGPFIESAIKEILTTGYTGYNLDMEPDTATPEDAVNYAIFLEEFATALHAVGKELTVDIADWTPFWNWTLLAKTSVDRFNLMSTYTGNFTIFTEKLEEAMIIFGPKQLGVGLESINPDTNEPYSNQELEERFNIIISGGALEIDIWDTPIPSNFFPFIDQFIDNGEE